MSAPRWQALVLAAGRGVGDPLASAHGVANKCLIPVAAIPMLRRVHEALAASGLFSRIAVSIDDEALAHAVLGRQARVLASSASAPASVLAAIGSGALQYPVLITTGDHALLTPRMLAHFCAESEKSGADFTVGLARAETILAAYPQSLRTFFRLGQDRVSGCNLFALLNTRGLKLLERWQYLEEVRKKPWRLVAAFGPAALLRFALGRLSLEAAFATVSARLGLAVKPVLMPFAEAAIDIDKPEDKDLAEIILATRR
ncbi:MAG: NTP transferase domain-containing protein [Hyphomicrobiales bacterium]